MWSRALWTLQWNSGRYGDALLIFFTVSSKCCDFNPVICLSFVRFLTFSLSTWKKLQFFSISIVETLCCLSNKINETKYAARPLLLMRSPALSTDLLLRPSSGSFLISVIITSPLFLVGMDLAWSLVQLFPSFWPLCRGQWLRRGTGIALTKVGRLWNKHWVDFSKTCSWGTIISGCWLETRWW